MAKLERWENECVPGTVGWQFYCPGCKQTHAFYTSWNPAHAGAKPIWEFNGDMERPTFTPSLLNRGGGEKKIVCHLYLTAGVINFLSDCTHAMAGRFVPLEDMDG